jgi:hypothetical protein
VGAAWHHQQVQHGRQVPGVRDVHNAEMLQVPSCTVLVSGWWGGSGHSSTLDTKQLHVCSQWRCQPIRANIYTSCDNNYVTLSWLVCSLSSRLTRQPVALPPPPPSLVCMPQFGQMPACPLAVPQGHVQPLPGIPPALPRRAPGRPERGCCPGSRSSSSSSRPRGLLRSC